jgi:hypothetical protein
MFQGLNLPTSRQGRLPPPLKTLSWVVQTTVRALSRLETLARWITMARGHHTRAWRWRISPPIARTTKVPSTTTISMTKEIKICQQAIKWWESMVEVTHSPRKATNTNNYSSRTGSIKYQICLVIQNLSNNSRVALEWKHLMTNTLKRIIWKTSN